MAAHPSGRAQQEDALLADAPRRVDGAAARAQARRPLRTRAGLLRRGARWWPPEVAV
jgi:hypothetical protein